MSGGSQHNPNGRQAQLGAGWNPLQLQMASFLARAPQAHMADRGHTWHTPTPPPHLYHVPAPSPPDPLQAVLLQAMKASGNSVFRHTATPPELYRHTPTPPDKHHMSGMREEEARSKALKSGNSVFRHTATPPELYRHTPTPPDKHHMRHTPSPGDVKASAALPPADLYQHLGPGRDKLVRPEELLAYARGVDLSVGGARGSNGAPPPPPALSVRDAPTINSLIARAQPRAGHARVDALLERLSSPVSPHSVIVHSRATHTPSPPSSNEDSADSCGAPPGSKRKRKPERTVRGPAPPAPPAHPAHPARRSPPPAHSPAVHATAHPTSALTTAENTIVTPGPVENGEHAKENGPDVKMEESRGADTKPTDMEIEDTQIPQKPPSPEPHARRKEMERSGSAETIDDIAAMIAQGAPPRPLTPPGRPAAPLDKEVPEPYVCRKEKPRSGSAETIDDIAAMIAQGAPPRTPPRAPRTPPRDKLSVPKTPPKAAEPEKKEIEKSPETTVEAAAAPKRRSPRTSNSESTNVPVESPSEAKAAEPEALERSAEPTAASFVEVENQLEKMFAGIEEEAPKESKQVEETSKPKKRRKSAASRDLKPGRRSVRGAGSRRTGGARRGAGKDRKPREPRDATDSNSNASSTRSRGPYIQIRGPRDSPLSVSVVNAAAGDDDGEPTTARRKGPDEFRNGLRVRGLHASTLGLRYDATTPDATWLCAFCEAGPHARALGDLFGPYTADTDCEEYRSLDEGTRQRYAGSSEVWFHGACAVWAPGLLAAGARLWGLPAAVWGARGARCAACAKPGAGVACVERACRARAHVPCAAAAGWALDERRFQARCPRHA